MKILVTGSSGFLGEHLARLLACRGYSVLGVDTAPPPRGSSSVTYRRCDILNRSDVMDVLSDFSPTAIVHLAARTDLNGRSLTDYATNNLGTENLIAAIRAAPSVRRCVFTSSQLVCEIGYVPANDEDFKPNTLYGESKVLAEQVVRQLDGGGVEWCLVRPTTVWGPGMNAHYQAFFRLVRAGRYFHVGHDPLFKSYGYVGNVIHQYLRFLEASTQHINRRVFYAADYQPLSLREWANAFQREFGAPPIPTLPKSLAIPLAKVGDTLNAIGYCNFPFNSFRLKNILTEYQFDLSSTEAICGALPYDFDLGVKETAAWFMRLSR